MEPWAGASHSLCWLQEDSVEISPGPPTTFLALCLASTPLPTLGLSAKAQVERWGVARASRRQGLVGGRAVDLG